MTYLARRFPGRSGGLAGVALLGLALLAACRSSRPEPVDFGETPRNFLPKDYGNVYERWTRYARVVSPEGLVIEAWATLKSWEFREAFVEFYADLYKLPSEEKATLRRGQLEESRQVYEIHLTAQMNAFRWNDFEKRQSAWRIVLVDGAGNELEPESIEVSQLPELYENTFYPRMTPFTRSYVVRFPLAKSGVEFAGPATGLVMLQIAGPRGTAEMSWVTE